MAQFLSAVSAGAVILALVGTGVFCGWRGWMTAAHKNFCVKVVINIGIPAMCLNSLLRQVDMALLRECGILVAIAAADVLILLALALDYAAALVQYETSPLNRHRSNQSLPEWR